MEERKWKRREKGRMKGKGKIIRRSEDEKRRIMGGIGRRMDEKSLRKVEIKRDGMNKWVSKKIEIMEDRKWV